MLSLLHNPVASKEHYRLYVAHKIPQVRILDFRKVKLKVCCSSQIIKIYNKHCINYRNMKQLKHYSKEKKEKNLKRSWLRNLINLFLEKVLKPKEQIVNKMLKFTYFPVTKISRFTVV